MAEGEQKLKIPIGVDNFIKIRKEGYYFVDKSELISDILRDGSEVFLFTRPRRFGKSLNLSMLDAFFNLEYKGNNWFDGLKINDHPEVEDYRNTRPVIFLSMKDLYIQNFELFISHFGLRMKTLYENYNYLATSDKLLASQISDYQRVITETASIPLLSESLLRLCTMLELHHGMKPIVLVDEYDHNLNHAYGEESFKDILGFLRNFYSGTFKSNQHLGFAVVTGVMQIAKEGIFSGLNNLLVNNIFRFDFDERYGFTNPEVKEICSYYGHPEKYDEVKEWYDGYRFGNADIYNPWSVLNYIKNQFIPDTYWAGTSGNDIIDTLLQNADDKIFKDLTTLGNGGTIVKDLTPTVAMSDLIDDPETIFSVFAVAGYLNAVPSKENYLLSIPNREMYSVFYTHLKKFAYHRELDPFAPFLDALEEGNVENIENTLNTFLQNFSSVLLSDEGRYHMILAVMVLGRKGKYMVQIDRESGDGRHDILMKSKLPRYPNIVVEIKKANSEDSEATVDRLAHEALDQIHRKDYCRDLKGKTLLYGIAFKAKTAKALLEETCL